MTRIDREAATVAAMVRLYCRVQEHPRGVEALCPTCAALLDYANARLVRCPFGEGKTTCARCPIHCYQPERRAQIRQVMRTAGPRMLIRHPLMTLSHMVDGLRKSPKKKNSKANRPSRKE